VRRQRIFKILISIFILFVLVYLRANISIFSGVSNKQVVKTVLSLLVVLVSLRTLIEVVILWYNLDNRPNKMWMKDNLIVGLSNLFTIIAIISLLLGILSILGLDLKEVFTSLSIFAAAIAIIFKEFISEIIIGVINGFSSKIEIDDYVEYNGEKGKIIDIGLQKITLLNDEDDIVYIPNTKFYNSEVVNFTKRDLIKMSVDFQVDVHKLESTEHLERILIQSCQIMNPYILANTFSLKVQKVTKDYIDYKFQYTLKEAQRDVQKEMKKIVLRSVSSYITKNRKFYE
jgi:small-conductance mechanosensitive channel